MIEISASKRFHKSSKSYSFSWHEEFHIWRPISFRISLIQLSFSQNHSTISLTQPMQHNSLLWLSLYKRHTTHNKHKIAQDFFYMSKCKHVWDRIYARTKKEGSSKIKGKVNFVTKGSNYLDIFVWSRKSRVRYILIITKTKILSKQNLLNTTYQTKTETISIRIAPRQNICNGWMFLSFLQ